ncbi:MAG: hypothetical protein ACOYXU_08720 [Nitrospirota bacterium]
MSKSMGIKVKIALIAGAATVIAAVIGGLSLFLSKGSDTPQQEMRDSSQSIQVGRDLNITNVESTRPTNPPSSVARFPFEVQMARAKERIRYLAEEYLHGNVMSLIEVTGQYGDNQLDSPNLYDWAKVIEELQRQGYVKILNRDQRNIEFVYTGSLSVQFLKPKNGDTVLQFSDITYKIEGVLPPGYQGVLLVRDPRGQYWSWGTSSSGKYPHVQFGVVEDTGHEFEVGILITTEDIPIGRPTVARPAGLLYQHIMVTRK